jgi:hypothetical protein
MIRSVSYDADGDEACDPLEPGPACDAEALPLLTGRSDDKAHVGRPDGNLIDEDTQWRKLELLVATSEQIWG